MTADRFRKIPHRLTILLPYSFLSGLKGHVVRSFNLHSYLDGQSRTLELSIQMLVNQDSVFPRLSIDSGVENVLVASRRLLEMALKVR